NAPGGTFNVTSAVTIQGINGSGGLFANAGQFKVSPGSGNTATRDVAFNNTGTVSVTSGTFTLAAGGTSSGSFVVAAVGTLNLGNGAYSFPVGSSVNGAGNFSVSGATVNENGTFNVGGILTFSGGTANFLGSYSISGNT